MNTVAHSLSSKELFKDRTFVEVLMSALWIATLSAAILLSMTQNVFAEGSLKQNFKQADIKTVIEAVAKISGKNFIIDPRVKGNVTFIAPEGMNPDELYDSLLAILNVYGYVAIPGDGGIKIVPTNLARDQIPYRTWTEYDEDWVTEVITIRNVEASKLVAVLRPLIAKEGHLVALSESNKLIVSDTVSNIKRLKSILKRVDVDVKGAYEVITIKHTSAVDLAKTLKSVVPKGQGGVDVTIGFDARSNRIILSGDELKRMMLRALVADLDVQVDAEGGVQVIYLRYAKATDLAPVLQKIAGNRALQTSVEGQVAGGDVPAPAVDGSPSQATGVNTSILNKSELQEHISIEADERMNALIISAPTTVVNGLKSVIKQLDIRRAQVLIEAIFVEIAADKAAELGVEWGLAGTTGAGVVNFSGALPALIGNSGDLLAQSNVIGRGITLGAGEVNSDNTGWGALLRALNTNSYSNILATPSILTLDNEEAEILVGREVPFQTGSYASTTTTVTNPFTTIERKNVGLKLKVKPQINEGNEVYLEIDQEVSDVIDKGEAVDIQTSKRQIKTRVIVGDGNMVVLGGLINEKETRSKSKVPGLGDLPVIGDLFSSSQDSREKVNLMVFLRPVIIRNNDMSDYYSNKKYNYVYQEQDEMLHQDDINLLEGLRPRLPTLEQWKKGEPATPFDEKPEVKTEKVASQKDQMIYETSTDELLGF
ncbi:type II secretion system secretin GspD [Thiomicrorhabdus lithotrophica]|uniref:Type II secretion system secretin GspD n=1 Tax=Thiomicrorhabdus lithotrophica TaxID=2949997 RepID=A0ABY8CEG3_9GAMM|nr:type II secretion system secretin GspD [Thiomicrorhabdus lithotrophica]WEJ62523.1 type II secretion system secretin GspD [Thiomicrorhabdus lithotrophica]